MPRSRTLRRDVPSGQGRSEGTGKPDCEARNVGIGLNSRCDSGRPAAELAGAWCLKPYWGKPTVRNFREGGWKRDYGSRTEAQRESLGIATEPYRARQCSTRQRGIGPWNRCWEIRRMPRNSIDVSTKQERIAALAKQLPQTAFTSLAYLMDINWLKEAYRRTRKDGAVGVDGMTAAEYEQDLEGNLQRLLDRAKSGTYRATPGATRSHGRKLGPE